MKDYRLFKRDRFLERSTSFLIVSFFSNPHAQFVAFKNALAQEGLEVKVVKSRSVLPCFQRVWTPASIQALGAVSAGPVLVLQAQAGGTRPLLDRILSLGKTLFLEQNMSLLYGNLAGRVYTAGTLFQHLGRGAGPALVHKARALGTGCLPFLAFLEGFLLQVLLLYLHEKGLSS